MLLPIAVLAALLIGACSSLPGLRVLTGQDVGGANAAETVEALDLVMADKTGSTEPALIAAADRIESASGTVDVIEIRQDAASRVFRVNLLFSPPQVDTSTQQGQIQQVDALRRAIELTWQGTMLASQGSDVLQIILLQPQGINTLDNGTSYVGIVVAQAQIDRAAAVTYLAGQRSLTTFYDLIVTGTLNYASPDELQLYQGVPNHPMFMLPATAPQQ
jgi:hypothetical protein